MRYGISSCVDWCLLLEQRMWSRSNLQWFFIPSILISYLSCAMSRSWHCCTGATWTGQQNQLVSTKLPHDLMPFYRCVSSSGLHGNMGILDQLCWIRFGFGSIRFLFDLGKPHEYSFSRFAQEPIFTTNCNLFCSTTSIPEYMWIGMCASCLQIIKRRHVDLSCRWLQSTRCSKSWELCRELVNCLWSIWRGQNEHLQQIKGHSGQ